MPTSFLLLICLWFFCHSCLNYAASFLIPKAKGRFVYCIISLILDKGFASIFSDIFTLMLLVGKVCHSLVRSFLFIKAQTTTMHTLVSKVHYIVKSSVINLSREKGKKESK